MKSTPKIALFALCLCSISAHRQALPPQQTIIIEESESITAERAGPSAEAVNLLDFEALPNLINIRHDFLDLTLEMAENL